MRLTRKEKIKRGLIWTVHTHESISPFKVFFEGTRTACIRWLKENHQYRNYKRGIGVRLGEVIWED